MRQRKAVWVIAGAYVVLIGCLIVFGCERPAGPNGAIDRDEMSHAEDADVAAPADTPAETAPGAEAEAPAGDAAQGGLSGKVVDGVRVVEVAARQFEFDPATIEVREGEQVRLDVTSQDVTHGFAIEELGIDEALPPHETKTIEFTADKAGTYVFRCSVYCGKGHNDMKGQLVVRAAGQ
jgi:nitrosocyanin